MDYIRKTYGVPAKRGARVQYVGDGFAQAGTITGSNGSHLWIRLDGWKHSSLFHPTWALSYLDDASPAARGGQGGGE